MSDSENFTDGSQTLSSTVTGEITVAAVIIVFMLFAIALILYLRLKGYSGAIGSYRTPSRRLIFARNRPNVLKQSLDPSILNSLPVTIFRSEDFQEEGGVECAVCLTELIDGEKARFLPKCNHGFHVECIDMWFHSNNTCPLCRNLVVADIPASKDGHSAVLENPEANVVEGCSSSCSSLGDDLSEKIRKETLVITMPRQAIEGEGIKLLGSERTRSL